MSCEPAMPNENKCKVQSSAVRHDNAVNSTKTSDIVIYLQDKMKGAKVSGATSIKIKSGNIHKELGLVSRMPMVCQAMRKLIKDIDIIHYRPPKGNGATLEIEYQL
jgi:hypothetical protein